MKRIFIWWHRRWASHHDAWRAKRYVWGECAQSMFHTVKRDWHLEQMERLSAPERKLPAPPKIGLEGSETARD
jgi:hypothetical protein